ncbi:MAG TPA: transposase family protein [Gammaproteobacteria bacterium]|nr:transposase family protein [Gammaproteobacteria bacterium]
MAPTGEFEGYANSLQSPEGPLPGQATTGLTSEQFDELVERVEQRVTWNSGQGRPRELMLRQAVKAVVMYFRTNITQEVIAELLFVDQSTISRAISDLEEIIAEALDEFIPELPEEIKGRVGVVDGSLCPCWSWADSPELYSGKHKTTGHAHQFVCDLSGNLLHISDPLPGKTHDAKAMDDTGLRELLGDENALGDKGYLGTGITVPYRRPAGGKLLNWQKEFNTTINKIRYVIERAIAYFKTWRCMHTDYRRPKRTYATAFEAVRALHFFKLSFA